MRVWVCPFMLWCLGSHSALAQDRDYGRSMVMTDRGIVASSQFLASQAGAKSSGAFLRERASLCAKQDGL